MLPLLDLLLALNPRGAPQRFHRAKLWLTVPDFEAAQADLEVRGKEETSGVLPRGVRKRVAGKE